MSPRARAVALALLCVGCASARRPPASERDLPPESHRPAASAAPVAKRRPAEVLAAPHDPESRRGRAASALPPGSSSIVLLDAGVDSPYVVALASLAARGEVAGGQILALVDVRHEPGLLIGRHDLPDGSLEPRRILAVRGGGSPAVLAELVGPAGATACGWLLSPARSRFLCAPKVAGLSEYETIGGDVVESWSTDFPPAPVHAPTRTGRRLRLSAAGRWAEVDGFRCLGRPVTEVSREAGARGVRRWQRDSVARLTRMATHERQAFDDERAAALLRDATDIDACAPEPWRLLGRMRFHQGDGVEALPALATAVALDSHEPAFLVDLADCLRLFDPDDSPEAASAWAVTKEILDRPSTTRPLAASVSGPGDLARELYRLYLEQTSSVAARHQIGRRRVRGELERMR